LINRCRTCRRNFRPVRKTANVRASYQVENGLLLFAEILTCFPE
jgi:hypothetical protein